MSVMTTTRHHLLTPAASIKPTQPSKKHIRPAPLPISVPVRKSAHAPHGPPSRHRRDPSPDMLFEMSPAEDAPIHYRSLAIEAPSTHVLPHIPVPAPITPPRLPPSNPKNRLSLVDASLHPCRTAPVSVSAHQPEPFLYAFPTLSPANTASVPHSLPTNSTRTRKKDRGHTTQHSHTPSPPFARGGVHAQIPTPPLTGAFRGQSSDDNWTNSGVGSGSDISHDLAYETFFSSAADAHWPLPPLTARTVRELNPSGASPSPRNSFRADVRQYELERGRQRVPKHRRN